LIRCSFLAISMTLSMASDAPLITICMHRCPVVVVSITSDANDRKEIAPAWAS
jgi:hypothetical protein